MELWKSRPRPTQAEFGEMYEIGNQSAVGHFLHGRTPLSPKAAAGFARGLNCRVADFSPRLADQLGGLGLVLNPQAPTDSDEFPSGFLVRLPEGLRSRIAEVAKANRRSTNAEIVERLQQSFDASDAELVVSLSRDVWAHRKELTVLGIAMAGLPEELRAAGVSEERIKQLDSLGRAARRWGQPFIDSIGLDAEEMKVFWGNLGFPPSKYAEVLRKMAEAGDEPRLPAYTAPQSSANEPGDQRPPSSNQVEAAENGASVTKTTRRLFRDKKPKGST